ncbi:hypothetical protein QTG54_007188 [Skeletonema marinoi]|uniref:Uncharacterized protein n=1 Tax=Skeletonema marinoi TaxID=267567 RepID=A0AAD9DDC2_9STRA|nr:hypothetical protein QTG54_007188 [Skeletonema marinoi]
MMAETKKKKRSSSRRKKQRAPFFPNSPLCVGSPTNGVEINRRKVRQLTPQKLCSLALPPPLLSLFDADGSIAARGGDEQSVGKPSNASISAGSTGTHHNARLPSHIRVGFAKCDPLLVFGGQYVLVGTADGRIAIYSIVEFDRHVSLDIKMSERRRQREWEEEDNSASQKDTTTKEEKKVIDDEINFSSELAEEENEWEIRERMNRRERARLIDPLLVVTLPISRHKNTSSVGDEDQGSASVFSPSTIIAMCATPKTGTSLVEQRSTSNPTLATVGEGFLGHVAVLTDDAVVHVLEFSTPDSPKQISESKGETSSSNAADSPVVNILLSFETENSNATSICMRKADSPALRLCVGSESGLLTEFQLHSTSYHHSITSSPEPHPIKLARQRSHETKLHTRPDANPLQRQFSEPGSSPSKTRQPVKVTLCWQGLSDAPIRSLSCPGWGGTKAQSHSLLVVGTEQRQYANATRDSLAPLPNQDLSPAISLDMINASLAESMWRESNVTGDSSSNKAIPLSDCSVWPAAGMELKDGWLRGTTKRKPDVKQQLINTTDLQRVSTTSKLCCFEESQKCFASATSDGTVSISHCLEEGSWGITDENNQIMLFQQCIGLGTIESGNERYLACCLRGGTIYLVPVAEGNNPRKDIVMYATPVDSADCGAVRYIQNFAAGLTQVKSWQEDDDSSSMKYAAMIGWSGGKIDVYELNAEETRENLLLDILAERGTLSNFVKMLMNMDKRHNQLESSTLWKQAWDECTKANEVESVVNRIRNPNDDTFEGTRLLILSLMNGT